MLSKVVARWAGIEFSAVPYNESKDVFILSAVDDIQARPARAAAADGSAAAGPHELFACAGRAHPEPMKPSSTADDWVLQGTALLCMRDD
jgi:hypothetical protein